MRSREDRGRLSSLTPREREVLSHSAEGLTAREVAARLGISRKTVEQHRGRILLKLGVSNQAQAVALLAQEQSGTQSSNETDLAAQ